MRVRLNRCHQTGASNRHDSSEQSFPGVNRAASLADSTTVKPTTTSKSLSKTAAATAAFKSTVESMSSRKHAPPQAASDQPQFRTTFTLQQRNIDSVHVGDDM